MIQPDTFGPGCPEALGIQNPPMPPRPRKISLDIGGVIYSCTLVPVNNANGEAFDLVCVPCNTPTATYDVARITLRNTTCLGDCYYQAFINTDPVCIIQDCNLNNIICRAVQIYVNNLNNTRTTTTFFGF